MNVKYVINEYKKKPDVNFSSYKDKKRGPEESYFNKISAEIFLELITNMVSKVPLEFNLNYASWSGEAIVEYLQERHQLNVTRDYVYYFLNRFEVNSKFGKRINPSKDYEAMQAFIKDKYRQICEEAKTRGEVLIFGDETSCQKGYHQRGFAPKGKRAIVMHTTDSVHTGHSLFNLIGPGGFFKMFLIKGTFDAIIFKNCLKKLHEEFPTIKFLLILDNSRVHHAKLIKKWSERLEKKEKDFFRIEWLPAYCPELNPVEYLNNDYKTFIKKKGEISKDDVINISKQYISSYVDGDEKQMRQKIINFFKAKDCSYSLDIYNEVFKK